MTDAQRAWLVLLNAAQEHRGVEEARRRFVEELRRYERMR